MTQKEKKASAGDPGAAEKQKERAVKDDMISTNIRDAFKKWGGGAGLTGDSNVEVGYDGKGIRQYATAGNLIRLPGTYPIRIAPNAEELWAGQNNKSINITIEKKPVGSGTKINESLEIDWTEDGNANNEEYLGELETYKNSGDTMDDIGDYSVYYYLKSDVDANGTPKNNYTQVTVDGQLAGKREYKKADSTTGINSNKTVTFPKAGDWVMVVKPNHDVAPDSDNYHYVQSLQGVLLVDFKVKPYDFTEYDKETGKGNIHITKTAESVEWGSQTACLQKSWQQP